MIQGHVYKGTICIRWYINVNGVMNPHKDTTSTVPLVLSTSLVPCRLRRHSTQNLGSSTDQNRQSAIMRGKHFIIGTSSKCHTTTAATQMTNISKIIKFWTIEFASHDSRDMQARERKFATSRYQIQNLRLDTGHVVNLPSLASPLSSDLWIRLYISFRLVKLSWITLTLMLPSTEPRVESAHTHTHTQAPSLGHCSILTLHFNFPSSSMFLAARSRWMKPFLERYFIPLAISRQNLSCCLRRQGSGKTPGLEKDTTEEKKRNGG